MRKINPTLFALCATLLWVGAAHAQRYVDNGNGTVSDTTTGLMWEQKTTDGSVHDVTNRYRWGGTKPDGTAFIDFLGTLNNGLSKNATTITNCFANHCDWRLPSIVELRGILDRSAPGCAAGKPCIDSKFGPTQPFYYWSATTADGGPDFAWGVYFDFAEFGSAFKANEYYVRAVRGGVSP